MNHASLRYTLEEIQKAGNWLWELMQQNRVIALHGSMGAGKTTLVHTLCSQLEVKDPVSSPTFSLINEYQLPGMEKMYHIDLYRIRNEQEALDAGIEDALYSGAYCIVEWPEKAPGIFPEDTLHVTITIHDDLTRIINLNS
ncbi:MAG: tRNA (adenosine(37)-N6)-threonylcarbamoyltransferase complex ATPase subunit type 1 TsaE [Chitinophagaceae bacterium]